MLADGRYPWQLVRHPGLASLGKGCLGCGDPLVVSDRLCIVERGLAVTPTGGGST